MVVKLEERTPVVVGLADFAVVSLAEDGGVKETTKHSSTYHH